MFPKGPRFDPLKVPEGPAPNAYNPQEAQFDAYKRGAFLEKADRFTKTGSDIPGPVTSNSNSDVKKHTSTKSKPQTQSNMREKYNILQKKLEDLEKVHQEGKRLHQIEVERLAADLLRSQRTATEQAERIEKQRKQSDTLESRAQELRKTAQLDQAEIKGLKSKLKMVEHDKSQLSGKQTDVLEMKKTLQDTEAKHRDELRARDKRITQLEKSFELEAKRRELLEDKLLEMKTTNARVVQNTAKETESQLIATKRQLSHLQNQLQDVQDSFAFEREGFLSRLTHHRDLLSQAAQDYGQLHFNTVSSSKYRKMKTLHHMAEMKILRLERKLGNAEGQATELANLIRQVNDQNTILLEQLKDSLYQIDVYENLNNGSETPYEDRNALECNLQTILDEKNRFEQERAHDETRLQTLLAHYYDLRAHQLLLAFTCTDKEFVNSNKIAQQHSRDLGSVLASHEAIASSLENAQKERSRLDDEIHSLQASHATAQGTCIFLEEDISTLKEQCKQAALTYEATLKKEKTLVKRLNESIQKCKATEDSMRSEIDRLHTELADAERYQEAYNSLSEEIGLLVARKQLAEEEADRLGKFNAEILGHNNPAQRIAYVDRIRRELAEAKHKIVMLSRDQEAVVGLNADLQHEVDMYKSVMSAEKPRTHVTRVQRVPLSTHNTNATAGLNNSHGVSQHKSKPSITRKSYLEPIPGNSDMTLHDLE